MRWPGATTASWKAGPGRNGSGGSSRSNIAASGCIGQRGAKGGEPAVGVLLDRAERAAERVGGLLLGAVGQVAQDDDLPLPPGQLAQEIDEVRPERGVAGVGDDHDVALLPGSRFAPPAEGEVRRHS